MEVREKELASRIRKNTGETPMILWTRRRSYLRKEPPFHNSRTDAIGRSLQMTYQGRDGRRTELLIEWSRLTR